MGHLLLHMEDLFPLEDIFRCTSRKHFIFPYSSILYLESTGHKVIVCTADGQYELYGKLDELERSFPPQFIRCHKSFLVNMDRTDSINKAHQLLLDDGTALPVSKLRYGRVKERFLEYVVCK